MELPATRIHSRYSKSSEKSGRVDIRDVTWDPPRFQPGKLCIVLTLRNWSLVPALSPQSAMPIAIVHKRTVLEELGSICDSSVEVHPLVSSGRRVRQLQRRKSRPTLQHIVLINVNPDVRLS